MAFLNLIIAGNKLINAGDEITSIPLATLIANQNATQNATQVETQCGSHNSTQCGSQNFTEYAMQNNAAVTARAETTTAWETTQISIPLTKLSNDPLIDKPTSEPRENLDLSETPTTDPRANPHFYASSAKTPSTTTAAISTTSMSEMPAAISLPTSVSGMSTISSSLPFSTAATATASPVTDFLTHGRGVSETHWSHFVRPTHGRGAYEAVRFYEDALKFTPLLARQRLEEMLGSQTGRFHMQAVQIIFVQSQLSNSRKYIKR